MTGSNIKLDVVSRIGYYKLVCNYGIDNNSILKYLRLVVRVSSHLSLMVEVDEMRGLLVKDLVDRGIIFTT